MANCGLGVSTFTNYYYVDCCGNLITVTGGTAGTSVTLDYDSFYSGIEILELPTEVVCPTPTPTPTIQSSPTPTITSSNTTTPTTTPTFTSTPTLTPTETGYYVLANECQVFTLFDMGLMCQTIQEASSSTTPDGILKVFVTGGTSPYTYLWQGGQRTNTLTNVLPGSYPITVVDYYGDYTASTICQLLIATPTPSVTPTQTLTPSAHPACVELCLIAVGGPITYGPWQFVCNGTYNGRQVWTYNSEYNIVWSITNNRWEVVENDLVTPVIFENTRIMVSTSQSYIPLSYWSFYGTGSDRYSFSVTQGTCPSEIPLSYSLTINNNNCSDVQNCTGSIIVSAQGGTPGYSYSIDNGFTYQTSNIFNNVCPGNYTVAVQDSLGNIVSRRAVVENDGNNVTYEVSVQNTGSNTYSPTLNSSLQNSYFELNINPPLPNGTSLVVSMIIDFEIQNQGPWFNDDPDVTANYIISPQIFKNNVDISGSIITNPTSFTIVPRPQCSPSEIKVISGNFTLAVVMNAGDTLTGEISCQLTEDLPVILNSCVSTMTSAIQVSTETSQISGCYCCTIYNSNQPVLYTQSLVGYVG